ncbi:MAG: RNA-binding cell elongation regulator Jag/EloR [Acutalibacteraceae bacterium]|nr:RNA-binding cell elongation regulator Jag/EloR [Acutalibacteraceae bacterium]
MLREAIGIGDTEELAKEDALHQLGLDNANGVEFEIIKKAEKKKFGLFGGSPAKVKAIFNEIDDIDDSFITNKVEEPVVEEVIENTVEVSNEISNEEVSEQEVEANEEAVVANKVVVNSDYSPAEEARKYVENVLKAMGLEGIAVEVKEGDGSAEIQLSGEQIGSVIGRRGETLDALQYLAGLVANHVGNSYYRITINTGNYREKREKTLEILGRKLAFKVVKTGRNVSLEPMNPYERRIIHTAVHKVNGAISWSEGEVTNRHVVIGPDPEYKRPYRKNNYNNRGRKRSYNNGYDKRRNYNNRNNKPNSDTTPVERAPKNEGESLSLYGRVETNNN